MVGMILGLLMGLAIGAFIQMLMTGAYDKNISICKHILSFLIPVITCIGIGLYIEKEVTSNYVDQYIQAKQTIESSLSSTAIDGLERSELVKQTIEQNQELAKYKYKSEKWYGFYVDPRVKDLEYIVL